ncbi:MAG: DUF3575 domain-containing protein [Duncaniella sp.]|nr:DUF3575 domain-containing protein [Duncaniella sp.]
MPLNRRIYTLIFAIFAVFAVRAQNVNIKTNLLPDAALSPNLGVEVGLAPHWSLDLTGQLNLWPVNDHKWKHWLVQPEARYWFCEYFAKHFVGLHLLGGKYNFGNIRNDINFLGSDFSRLTDHRYQGWAVGGGIAYGYSFLLSKHFNLELEIGVGYLYTKFDEFECKECGKKTDSGSHNYFGPTKAAVNLIYVF